MVVALKKKYAGDLLRCADRINRVQKTVVCARRWMEGGVFETGIQPSQCYMQV